MVSIHITLYFSANICGLTLCGENILVNTYSYQGSHTPFWEWVQGQGQGQWNGEN